MFAELFIIISQSEMILHITLAIRPSKPEVILLCYKVCTLRRSNQ